MGNLGCNGADHFWDGTEHYNLRIQTPNVIVRCGMDHFGEDPECGKLKFARPMILKNVAWIILEKIGHLLFSVKKKIK